MTELVNDCSPLRIPSDTKFYGVKAPSKELLEKCRNHLSLVEEEDDALFGTHVREAIAILKDWKKTHERRNIETTHCKHKITLVLFVISSNTDIVSLL